jgi:hypothetical protein
VRLEDVDMDDVIACTPQVAGGEGDRVHVLRIVSPPVRVRVGIHEGGVDPVHRPGASSDVARQSRVPARMDVGGGDMIADREPGRSVDGARRSAIWSRTAEGDGRHSAWGADEPAPALLSRSSLEITPRSTSLTSSAASHRP